MLVVLAVGLALLPTVAAHGAPSPKDQDTRLLADMNDDCGGDDAGSLSACQGTHDLIALDVREVRDDALGDVVVFRLFLNGGSGSLRDVLTLKANGAAKTFELRTSNNQDFQGSGWDRVSKAQSISDGTRFVVDATVKADSLGGVGAKLSEFKVEAWKGSTNGDFMPGSYHSPLGGNGGTPSSEAGDPQLYIRPDYTLRGPTYYVQVGAPGSQQVGVGGETFVQLDVKNALRTTAQSLAFSVTGADGVQARFHDANSPSGAGYSDTLRVDLPKGGSTVVHLALAGERAGATGTLTLAVRTDQGGLTTQAVPYTVVEGASATTTTRPTGSEAPDKDSPGAAAPLVAALLLALAAVASRRRT